MNLSGPDGRYHTRNTRYTLDVCSATRIITEIAKLHRRTTISVAGEAYGVKSLLSFLTAEFCGRGGGNEPRRLRQKLLPRWLFYTCCDPRECRRVRASPLERASVEVTSHRVRLFRKNSRERAFPLPANRYQPFVSLAVVSIFPFDSNFCIL